MNDDGYIDFDASLEKISKYNFTKISQFSNFEPEILMDKNHLFYFDSNGSIIKFDSNSNVIWKKIIILNKTKNYNNFIFRCKWKDLFVADT